MRYASGSIAAAVALFLVTMAFWPDAPRTASPQRATAQDNAAIDTPPAKETPAKPKSPTPEENNARVEAMLVENRVNADFKDMALADFLDALRKLKSTEGKDLNLRVSLETRNLVEDGGMPDTLITLRSDNVRLDKMLDRILRPMGLNYYLDDGTMVVAASTQAVTHLEMRVYDCRDLMDLPRAKGRGAPDPGNLDASRPIAAAVAAAGGDPEFIELLVDFVAPDSWKDEGGPGTLTYYRGLLIVWASAPVHREMNQFLQSLRQAVAKQSPAAKNP